MNTKKSKNISFCRNLRQHQTEAEIILWGAIRNRRLGNFKFRRQYPYPPYILDFYCDKLRLALELDGYVHAYPDQDKKDKDRQDFIESKGITVIRYPNTYIKEELDEVLEDILTKCKELQDKQKIPSKPRTPSP